MNEITKALIQKDIFDSLLLLGIIILGVVIFVIFLGVVTLLEKIEDYKNKNLKGGDKWKK